MLKKSSQTLSDLYRRQPLANIGKQTPKTNKWMETIMDANQSARDCHRLRGDIKPTGV